MAILVLRVRGQPVAGDASPLAADCVKLASQVDDFVRAVATATVEGRLQLQPQQHLFLLQLGQPLALGGRVVAPSRLSAAAGSGPAGRVVTVRASAAAPVIAVALHAAVAAVGTGLAVPVIAFGVPIAVRAGPLPVMVALDASAAVAVAIGTGLPR